MRNTPNRCVCASHVLAALVLWLAASAVSEAEAEDPGASQAPPSLASPQEPLAVLVTSPQMNAGVGEGAVILLAAAPSALGDAIARVEFLDDGELVGTVTGAPYELAYRPAASKRNFRITARATDAAGRTAVSPPVTCVATRGARRQYRAYDYEETAKQFRLWIPDGLTTVRGILVVANYKGGDSRDDYKEVWYSEFMDQHGFAFLGTRGDPSHADSYDAMLRALKQIAAAADHPELLDAPYAATGFSAGGGFASYLLVMTPDKVIASVPCGARLKLPPTPSVASLNTPACIISGEQETIFPSVVEPVLQTYRPQGALFGWTTVQGRGHERCGQEVLAMPLLDAAVRLRYPRDGDVRVGPVKLRHLDPDSGWVADNTTWKSGLTSIAPASQFSGDIRSSSWLPMEDIAFIYRAYATYDRPLTITTPAATDSGLRVWDPGSNVTIVVDAAGFQGWQKLEFHDGARKLGEVTEGPPQFTAMGLAAGYHVFSVLGTDAQGSVRPSNPVLVVVRRLPAEG